LNTISNPAAVTLSPSGISDRFLFTSITFVEIYRKSVIRCCKCLREMVYYWRTVDLSMEKMKYGYPV